MSGSSKPTIPHPNSTPSKLTEYSDPEAAETAATCKIWSSISLLCSVDVLAGF